MQLRPSLKFIRLSYVFCLVVAVGVAVYWLAGSPPADIPIWAPLAVVAVLLLFTLIRHVQRRLVKLVITGDRLRYESGLFSKTTRTMELVKVQDVRVDRTLGQRIAGVGDLSFETAGSGSRIVMRSIDRPQEAADHILALAHAQRGASSQAPPAAGV